MDDPNAKLVAAFAKLPDDDPGAANSLFTDQAFSQFFPGNPRQQVSNPFERFGMYERGLRILQQADSTKFRFIHKGTPYYFLGWTAFDLRDYEQAIFYMDAAIPEDIRNARAQWQNLSAAKFLFLDKNAPDQSAKRITMIIHARIDSAVLKFNAAFGKTFTVDQLIQKYVRPTAQDKTHRSIVTSLYSFLLEAEDRQELLKLRSADGGSIEPFLVHLFKGCLVFESLLKEIYSGMIGTELGSILKDPFIQQDLEFSSGLIDKTAGIRKTLQDIVRHLVPFLAGESAHNKAITLTYALRNTTAHSLLWPDVFETAYGALQEAITFAIFYVISQKFKP